MKRILMSLMMTLLVIGLVGATPNIEIPLIGGGDPIYEEQKFAPLVFINDDLGRILVDDPYGFFANGDASLRTSNYLFTGEKIIWEVLVWDKNGVPNKISDVFAGWSDQLNGPTQPETQVNCDYISEITSECQSEECLLEEMEYYGVRRPNDQEDQVYFNPATMGIYECRLTVENPDSCHGQKWFGVKAVDVDGLEGTLNEASSYFCNPSLDLFVSGDIDFGTLGPGEQGSSTFSVENTGEDGSGVEVILSITGKDFYDPSPSGGICPTSNVLKLQGVEAPSDTIFETGFWYSANRGSLSTDGFKRIPYGDEIVDSDPIFSESDSSMNWRDWSGLFYPMTVGSETTMTLYLGIPQPCNGQFSSGSISLWALAV